MLFPIDIQDIPKKNSFLVWAKMLNKVRNGQFLKNQI